MPDTHPVAGTRPAGAPPYEPVVRIGTPPPAAMPSNQVPSRVHQTVLLPPDATDGDGDDDVALPAAITHATHAQAATSASNVRWYIYVASGLAGAVLVTAIYGLLGARSGSSANRADTTRAPVMDSAVLDRRADTLALAISAFSLRASMYDSRRMPCSGLARGLTQVEDAWLGYNLARKDFLAGSDAARDARDKGLYTDVRNVEVKFERSSCARP